MRNGIPHAYKSREYHPASLSRHPLWAVTVKAGKKKRIAMGGYENTRRYISKPGY